MPKKTIFLKDLSLSMQPEFEAQFEQFLRELVVVENEGDMDSSVANVFIN